MLGAREGGEILLELRHFRTAQELAVSEHAGNRLVEGLAEPLALGCDIDEGDGLRTRELVHGAL
jgi:hypothetical protein